MVVLRFEYNLGEGEQVLEFDRNEVAVLRRITNCDIDVQYFKNGLARVYIGPAVWLSGEIRFRQVGGTFAKVQSLAAARVPLKMYYRYHLDQELYLDVAMVPGMDEKYVVGHVKADDIVLKWVETAD